MLNALLYFPARAVPPTPPGYDDVAIETDDGERLHGWFAAARGPALARILLCHGNAGNVGDRVAHLELLTRAGFDVLAFDYRGYGRSTGRPSDSPR